MRPLGFRRAHSILKQFTYYCPVLGCQSNAPGCEPFRVDNRFALFYNNIAQRSRPSRLPRWQERGNARCVTKVVRHGSSL